MTKRIVKVIVILFAITCILFGIVIWALDGIIKKGYNSAAPAFLGVSTHLEHARVKPFRGMATLEGLTIGNPKGYKTDNLMTLGNLSVSVDLASLKTDTIIINEILISDLHVTYEQGLKGNNLTALLNNLSSEPASSSKKKDASEAPSKKVIIRKLDIEGGKVSMAAIITQGHALSYPLPPVHLTHLGESGKAMDAVAATREIVQIIVRATTEGISHAGVIVGDGVKAVGHGATEAGKTAISGATDVASNAVDGVKSVTGTVKGFFK